MLIFNFLQGVNIALAMSKVFYLVFDLLILIFLLVVLRQVSSMRTIVNDTNDSSVLRSTAIILLIISISLFLTALVIL